MDRQPFGIFIWKHVGKQNISNKNSKLGVSCRSLYASPMTRMHNNLLIDRNHIFYYQQNKGAGDADIAKSSPRL